MAKVEIKIDSAGIAEILKSAEAAAMVGDVAETVAANVRAAHPSLDVVVDRYTTDRAAASVTIRDTAGKFLQVRDGILTRAAAAAGAEVKSRST